MSKIRAILIDPYEKQVTKIEIEPKLKEFYRILGCDMIEGFYPLILSREGHFAYVDESGMFRKNQMFFSINTYPQRIAGKAIIFKFGEEGNELPCELSLEFVHSNIHF